MLFTASGARRARAPSASGCVAVNDEALRTVRLSIGSRGSRSSSFGDASTIFPCGTKCWDGWIARNS
eukprot:2218608-Prymnesium_polylepis.1